MKTTALSWLALLVVGPAVARIAPAPQAANPGIRRFSSLSKPAAGACPVPPGDSVRYHEIIVTKALARGDNIGAGDSARSDGDIALFVDDTGALAVYVRATTSAEPASGTSRVTAQFRFASGDCGGGIARLVHASGNPHGEIAHHLDGFLVTLPAGREPAPGATWDDTLRSDGYVASGDESSTIARWFRVTGDTTLRGTAAAVVSIRTDGSIIRREAAGNDSVRVIISESSRGTAIVSLASRVMLARCDSTGFRITATSGDMRMPEQRVTQRRQLRLVQP